MIRAGKEPAEDVVRRITGIYRDLGLNVHQKMNVFAKSIQQRIVSVSASPPGWAFKSGMVGVEAFVKISGDVVGARVTTVATAGDPVSSLFCCPSVRDAEFEIDELAAGLRLVLREREQVLRMFEAGKQPPYLGLHWTWSFLTLSDADADRSIR